MPTLRFMICLATLLFALGGAPAPPPAEVVDAIANQIERRYVIVDRAAAIATNLRAKLATGAFDSAKTQSALAEKLTEALRAEGDLHFAVEYDPDRDQRLRAANADKRAKLPDIPRTAAEMRTMRRNNFGFQRAEILDGNVGYIEMTLFENLDYSRDTALAALKFIEGADAVIIDIRRAPGGSGNTVGFLVSHFLPPKTPLMATFDRETGETKRGYTLAKVPGRRRTDVPLFIVAGPGTGSASEAFAFVLQQRGRAKVVGEKTLGAAHGGGWVPAADGFVVFIPTFRPADPSSGKSWEGVGVQPDIAAPSDRALAVAHLHALQSIEPTSELRWLIPLVDLDANGAKPVASALAEEVTGHYRGIEILLDSGTLTFLGASGVRRRMFALADDTFLIEDASVPPKVQARARFVRDESGHVIALELLTNRGDVIRRPRL